MDERATTDDDRRTGRPVRVSYVAERFGVALVVADGDEQPGTDGSAPADGGEHGVLHLSDAVVTLEIPLPDGGRSILSWDPTEVALDPLVA